MISIDGMKKLKFKVKKDLVKYRIDINGREIIISHFLRKGELYVKLIVPPDVSVSKEVDEELLAQIREAKGG